MVTGVKHTSKADTCVCVRTPYSIGHGLWEGVGPQERSLRTLPENPQLLPFENGAARCCVGGSPPTDSLGLGCHWLWYWQKPLQNRKDEKEWRINSRKFFQRGSLRQSVRADMYPSAKYKGCPECFQSPTLIFTNKLWKGFHFPHFRHEEVKLWKVTCFVPYSMSVRDKTEVWTPTAQAVKPRS